VNHPIVIPNLGLVEEVTLLEWLKSSGDRVEHGNVVAVIETEKAQVDIEAPAAGTLLIEIEPSPNPISAEAVLGFVDDGA
jgi:pyruvate/2-oxoglutarate dehydrogenase complex dihydrolipoamide acyltransferase (E2) component